jgi:UDP:flavonoid glycosyltransferase YjiC (YdhE family)
LNILLIALGSAGDVHPVVGMAIALGSRGHRVTVATSPYFEALVRRVGVEFIPVGTADELRTAMDDPDLWHPRRGPIFVVENLILAQLERVYELTAAFVARGNAVVVAPCTAIGARVAREKLGFPLVTFHLQPALIRSLFDTPVLGPLLMGPWVPRSLKRLQFFLGDKLLIDRLVNRGLTPFRAAHGLPPVSHVADRWWNSPDRAIGLFPDWFASPQPDWPPQVVLSGFPLWDERGYSAVPDELEAFLAAGEKPVVFTAGSAMLHAHEFFQTAVDACRRSRRRGILLTRHAEQLPDRLPDEVQHFDFVPLGSLLPRAAAILHHAGVGTLAQGLAAGIPHLSMPMSHDQPDNAARLRRLGVGLTIKPKHFRAERVAAALDQLIAARDVQERCRELAGRFDTTAALERTCREIELLGETRQ